MKYSIKNLREDFKSDDQCLDYIFHSRHGEMAGWYRVSTKMTYVQGTTGKQISPLAGTIFQKSTTPLTLWFYAIYLFSISKNGIAAKELERQLGVTYKTAWRMCSQIRSLMADNSGKLSGTVEIDEAFVGNTPVLGAVERGGKVRTRVVDSANGGTIAAHVVTNIEGDAKLMSDNNKAYAWLDRHYDREAVTHSKGEFVRGDVHTNTMDAFWGQVKSSVEGTHHHVSAKHLQSYLNFFAFQHAHRKGDKHPFFILLDRACK